MIKEEKTAKQILSWHLEAGVNETVEEKPVNRYREKAVKSTSSVSIPPISVKPIPANVTASINSSIKNAMDMSFSCNSLTELKESVEKFDGCSLKNTATNTVFGEGKTDSVIMLVGEAPGADEDRTGVPFVGQSGKLLSKILESAGLERSDVYISNILPWRPPGNRKPTKEETSICLPFIQRHIELVNPEILVLLGGSAATTLLAKNEGITKLRGKWFSYETSGLSSPVATIATFHPAYLLRSPAQKRKVWKDMLMIKEKLESFNN